MRERRRIFIPGEFQTLNDHENAARTHWSKGAESKKADTRAVQFSPSARDTLAVIQYPVRITFTWYRRNKLSDLDNIAFAKKSVLDGLVLAGVLKGDSHKFIREFRDIYEIDAKAPGVEILIESLL